jgi:hypothetical protein
MMAHRLPQNRVIGVLGWRVVGTEPRATAPTHVPATIWTVLDRLKPPLDGTLVVLSFVAPTRHAPALLSHPCK